MGGNLVSYAFDQEVIFNVLNTGDFGFGNTGLLELSFGKIGFKSQIGQDGLNVSYLSISSAVSGGMAWDMNNRINSTVNTRYEGDKNLANALRMKYGFGNKNQLSQLNDILNYPRSRIIQVML